MAGGVPSLAGTGVGSTPSTPTTTTPGVVVLPLAHHWHGLLSLGPILGGGAAARAILTGPTVTLVATVLGGAYNGKSLASVCATYTE